MPSVASLLLPWYHTHQRHFPWRGDHWGEVFFPYHVWLSEVMLQQTTTTAVKPYFLTFIKRWPTVEALAAAPLEEVLQVWSGLGYYGRAHRLHACAGCIVHTYGGIFPSCERTLLTLPGVGPYTAAAIRAIAFNKPAVVVDGNVERVMSRLFRVLDPLPRARSLLYDHARQCASQEHPAHYSQALMDLGATLCTPRSPQCSICPLRSLCRGQDKAHHLPHRPPRRIRPTRRGYVFWVEREECVLMRRRPPGLLGGMMEFPGTPWEDTFPDITQHKRGFEILASVVQHTFSHFHLELRVARVPTFPSEGCLWIPRTRLHEQALPSVMRKVIALVEG